LAHPAGLERHTLTFPPTFEFLSDENTRNRRRWREKMSSCCVKPSGLKDKGQKKSREYKHDNRDRDKCHSCASVKSMFLRPGPEIETRDGGDTREFPRKKRQGTRQEEVCVGYGDVTTLVVSLVVE
jgi:hypothetical protein